MFSKQVLWKIEFIFMQIYNTQHQYIIHFDLLNFSAVKIFINVLNNFNYAM